LKESITEEGNSFQKSFVAYKKIKNLIPTSVQQMVASGEQSGHLSDTLFQVGQIYEAKIETTTKNLSVILEPVLLVIVWLGVAAVAFAIILPIYSLIGGLQPK
jgi:type II secretory pathway component PulF